MASLAPEELNLKFSISNGGCFMNIFGILIGIKRGRLREKREREGREVQCMVVICLFKV